MLASTTRPSSPATTENTSCGSAPRATSVAFQSAGSKLLSGGTNRYAKTAALSTEAAAASGVPHTMATASTTST